MVTEPIDSWSVLWDTNYRDSILMQDSVRDAFAVALKDLGYSLNSTNIKELTEAKDLHSAMPWTRLIRCVTEKILTRKLISTAAWKICSNS